MSSARVKSSVAVLDVVSCQISYYIFCQFQPSKTFCKKEKALINAGTCNGISWLGLPFYSWCSLCVHTSSAFLQFATTAAEITMRSLACSSSSRKLICIYYGHRLSKKPNKQHHLWIRKETAGSGKKALRLIDAVRHKTTFLHFSCPQTVKEMASSVIIFLGLFPLLWLIIVSYRDNSPIRLKKRTCSQQISLWNHIF